MVEDQREYAIRMRSQSGLRADPAWVDHVAATGRDGGMTLNIPLTDDELAELHARYERTISTCRAVREATLPSAAGMWIDQVAGGLVHVLLAHPAASEKAAAEALVAGRHAVIDLVEHSTRDLEHVKALVDHAYRTYPDFAAAIVSYGIQVDKNTMHLQLRHDRHPTIAEELQAARTAGTLTIEYTTARVYSQ